MSCQPKMTEIQQSALSEFLLSLTAIQWFTYCGEPDSNYVVAADLVEAWDDWNSNMIAIRLPETERLERIAVGKLGESEVNAIFETVSTESDEVLRAGMEGYFNRRPACSRSTIINADRGLWPEWLESVQRDICWAAVEMVLTQPGFFTELLQIYRAGRWPCAWERSDRTGRAVVL